MESGRQCPTFNLLGPHAHTSNQTAGEKGLTVPLPGVGMRCDENLPACANVECIQSETRNLTGEEILLFPQIYRVHPSPGSIELRPHSAIGDRTAVVLDPSASAAGRGAQLL